MAGQCRTVLVAGLLAVAGVRRKVQQHREAQLEQRALWDKSVAEYSAKLKAAGVEWIEIDTKPFYDATAPVRAKYGANYTDLIKRINEVK